MIQYNVSVRTISFSWIFIRDHWAYFLASGEPELSSSIYTMMSALFLTKKYLKKAVFWSCQTTSPFSQVFRKTDPRALKAQVFVAWTLDTIHQILFVYSLYKVLVINFGNYANLAINSKYGGLYYASMIFGFLIFGSAPPEKFFLQTLLQPSFVLWYKCSS